GIPLEKIKKQFRLLKGDASCGFARSRAIESFRASACDTYGSTYIVQATGTDQYGNPLQPVTRLVSVRPVALQGNTLAVGGTTGTDKIYLTAADSTGTSVTVSINNSSLGTYQAGQIVVFGQAGNDIIQIKSATINK